MTVQGLDRLKRKLTKTIPQRALELTRGAMEKSADEIVAMMKRLVPRDTGQGEASIGWTWGDAPKGTLVIAAVQSSGGDLKITIYAGGGDAFYLRFQEFGTQKMSASPFFFVSWRTNRKRAAGRIKRAMKQGIKEGAQS